MKTIVDLNIERNKVSNLVVFAPKYVNILEVNLELVKQYPEIYLTTTTTATTKSMTDESLKKPNIS